MTSYVTDGTVGPWAKEKLECLGKYLHAYTTILRKQNWCRGYIYVDAFAGAGTALLRQYYEQSSEASLIENVAGFVNEQESEAERYVTGSPKVALSLQHPFTEYIFIEKSVARIAELNTLKQQYGETRNVSIYQSDANHAIRERLLGQGRYNWKIYRGLAFLDPFGMQVPWDTIEALGKTNAFEILLNLPVGMAIQRMLPRSGHFEEVQREKLDTYFGSPEWRQIVYEDTQDLFGHSLITKRHDAGEKLAKWYQERLKGAYGFSSRPRLITNTRGAHLYYLLWAGPNKNGAKIAGDVLKQGKVI
jgi:three-Cys-motif partner protein